MVKRFLTAAVLLLSITAAAVAADYRNITARDAKAILDKNKNVLFLDVRTPQETAQGYIPKALLLPINEIERRSGEIPKNRPIIVYCAVGSRSRSVAQFLARQGYGEVYNMTDGFFGWARGGLPTAR